MIPSNAMIRLPLADTPVFSLEDHNERLVWNASYQKWVKAKAPRLPLDPPLPIPDEGFLRRVRA